MVNLLNNKNYNDLFGNSDFNVLKSLRFLVAGNSSEAHTLTPKSTTILSVNLLLAHQIHIFTFSPSARGGLVLVLKSNGILIFMKIIDILNFFNNSIVGVGLL